MPGRVHTIQQFLSDLFAGRWLRVRLDNQHVQGLLRGRYNSNFALRRREYSKRGRLFFGLHDIKWLDLQQQRVYFGIDSCHVFGEY